VDSGYEVALKVIHPWLTSVPGFVDRLVTAFRAVTALRHLNIVPIHEVGEADGRYYVVSELPNGRGVDGLLREGGLPAPERAVKIAIQAAVVLDYAHARGVTHGAVKASNVIVGWDDRTSVVDFAITNLAEEALHANGGGAVLGRKQYASPELGVGAPATKASDRYAFAVLLFELLTGATPFPAGTGEGGPRQKGRAPQSVVDLRPELPSSLDPVFARALAVDPEERYGTCALLVQAVAGALKGDIRPSPVSPSQPPPARPPAPRPTADYPPSPPQQPPFPWRLLAPIAAALVLTLAAALALSQLDLPIQQPSASPQASPAAVATLAPIVAEAPTPPPVLEPSPTTQPIAEPTSLPAAEPTPQPATPVPTAGPPPGPPGTLVVVRQSEGNANSLFTVSPDGKNLVRLPGLTPGWQWAPVVSPDGQWLAMATGDPNKGEIAIARRDGSDFRVVARGGEYALSSPWWLADGRVAFTATAGARSEVFAASLQGGEAVQLTRASTGMTETRVPTSPATGAELAFTARLGGFSRVFVQGVTGQARAVSPERVNATTPAWSPDGGRIAFSASLADGRAGIFTVGPDGANLIQMAQPAPGSWSCCPTWSPDGKWLAFIGDLGKGQTANHGNLYVVPAAGGEAQKVLSDGATYYWRPCWLP
jgi:serine/threonine-protein kinase